MLPVLVLALFGILSLREDRRLARSEAAERARTLVDELVQRFWTTLTPRNVDAEAERRPAFRVDSAGQLLFPPPTAPWPVPEPLNRSELNPVQARLWAEIQMSEADQDNPKSGLKACRAFLDLVPPGRFVGAAQYSLGLLLARSG